jgi:1,4-dihydroxy-6-naphthoate synthase
MPHLPTKITLGYSPCPNDTFIFDAMVHQKIDTEGLAFETVLADVEALNTKAFAQELMVTKLSYHAFAHLVNHYALLHAGSALGTNCGPLLIAKQNAQPTESSTVAIPGKYTTANFLLALAFPQIQHKIETLFSDIEQNIIAEKHDFGLIIHENRFTYAQKGLVKIADLGELWEQRTQLPIPLGGIVVHRSLPLETQQKINRVLRRSVEFALANPAQTMDYVSLHAQEMQPEVMMAHINLYVNQYSVDLGETGKAAIQRMFAEARKLAVIPESNLPIFVDS